jgi:Tfp pilus assembly protein PilE
MATSRSGPKRKHHRRGLPSTRVEFLIVLIIVVILLLIAVPTYLSFKERASSAAARANLSLAVADINAYYLLSSGSYVGLDLHWLQGYDPSVKLNDPGATPSKQTATTYCVSSTVGGKTWYKAGPAAPITTTAC